MGIDAHLDCSSSGHPAQSIIALDEVVPQRRQRVQADHRIKDIAQRLVHFLGDLLQIMIVADHGERVKSGKGDRMSAETGFPPKLIVRIPSIAWTMMKIYNINVRPSTGIAAAYLDRQVG